MEKIGTFNWRELWRCSILVNQRIMTNYLKNFSGYHYDLRDMGLTYSNLITKTLVNPSELMKIFNFNLEFLKTQQEIIGQTFLGINSNNHPIVEPQNGDKRFTDSEWNKNPYLNFLKQNYLLLERLAQKIVDEVELDEKIRKKLDFYVGHYMDAFSPTNFLFTNPEAMKLAIETKGQSILDGLNNLIIDLEKGKISQTDESVFEVGKNLAVTPGAVVYEDDLMQLIQYRPSTKKVHEMPLVIIPPWINKYYILDLEPKNSFVKFLIDKGISVFIISWRNPMPDKINFKFDDYIEKGAIKAFKVAQSISGVKKINALGYCLGGTLLSVAASILSRDTKENPINSITFLASMIDFSDIGPMGDVINGSLIRKLERGELLNGGVMHGPDMETAFNLIRANDLIWRYVINNYLEGKKPSPFDVLYWTNDNTNLPADMYKYYMREMVFENKLSRKNALRICNTPIDIGKIQGPVFVVGLMEDIISPAKTVFTTTELIDGQVEYILGGSGHVIGAINHPSKNKYGYYLNGKLGNGFEQWKKTAKYYDGSWWTPWTEKIIELSGKEIPAPLTIGNEKYAVIEPAPGSYVKEKCDIKLTTLNRDVTKQTNIVSKTSEENIKELIH